MNKSGNLFKTIIVSLVSMLILSLITPNTLINAKHHTYSKRHIHRMIHRYHRHNYLVGNLHHPIYILNWTDIEHFRNYKGIFRAKDDFYNLPVQIKSKVHVGNNIFDKIKFSNYYRHLNGWVYSGLISHNSRHGYYMSFRNLINNTMSSEINYNAPKYLSQMKKQTFKDLNNDRKRNHISPLKYDNQLNLLARIRARQISTYFSHYDRNGTPYTTDDASLVNLPGNFQASENIASAGLGNNRLKGSSKRYYNRNGYNMADTDNNGMMYHDQAEQNGHRYNILSPENTLVGIGTAYNPRTRSFFLAEDFGNYDPLSSENVETDSNSNNDTNRNTINTSFLSSL